jgi:pilin isopeptide linkage protein
MKKTTKKLTAIMAAMLTVATVGTTAAMPVFATTPNTDTAASGTGLITDSAILPVQKSVRTKNNGVAPSTTFTFTIAADTRISADGEVGKVTTAANTTVYQGVTTGIKVGDETTNTMTITFGDGENETTTTSGDTDVISETKNFDLSGVSFPKEGIYRYVVSETTPTNNATTDADGKLSYVTYDTTTYTVDVYVEKGSDGNLTVKYIHSEHNLTDGSSSKYPIIFTNSVASGNLNIVKELAGNNYSATDTFDFYVTINAQPGLPADTELKALITRAGETSSTEETTIKVGTETKLTLGKDDSLEVYGVFADTTYSVSEVPGTYTGTYELDKAGTETSGSAATADVDGKAAILTNETVVSGTNELIVTNTKNSTVDSGIVMTITPIAIAGGLAAAGAILVVTKRKLKK